VLGFWAAEGVQVAVSSRSLDGDHNRTTMDGFLLLSPTGSGKSWVCIHDDFFANHAMDGDELINWNFDWTNVDWVAKDREHLDIVLAKIRDTGKCVCWFVGPTAVADALNHGHLCHDQVAVVLLPESEHRSLVDSRNKKGHGWEKAVDHRTRCEALVSRYGLHRFGSFTEAAAYLQTWLENRRAQSNAPGTSPPATSP